MKNIGFRFWDSMKLCSCKSRISFHKKQKLSSCFHVFSFSCFFFFFNLGYPQERQEIIFIWPDRHVLPVQEYAWLNARGDLRLQLFASSLRICAAVSFQRRTLNIIIINAFNPWNTEIKTGKPLWYYMNA